MNKINLENKGLRMDADIFYPPELKAGHIYPAILFVHGWTSSRDRNYQYAESVSLLGYVCMVFDMRGHGTSEGDRMELSNEDFLGDVLLAYDHLANMPEVDVANISVVGSSFGGYLSAVLCSQRKLVNAVLRVPADYPNEEFAMPKKLKDAENTMAWREKEKVYSETTALQALSNFDGRVLVIESELDEQIPQQTILNYVNAFPEKDKIKHVVMQGAPHSIKEGKFRDEVTKILVDYFTSVI